LLEIRLHDDALNDLGKIRAKDPAVYARLLVFVEEYLDDANLRGALGNEDFANEVFEVDRFTILQQQALDIWRVKLKGLDVKLGQLVAPPAVALGSRGQLRGPLRLDHRILYAFDLRRGVIWILGVFHRDEYDYSPTHAVTHRITVAYDGLGLPKLKHIH